MAVKTIYAPAFCFGGEVHYFGAVVDLSAEAIARGNELGAFTPPAPSAETPVVDTTEGAPLAEPVPPVTPKRGPGRPRKNPVEG